MFVVSVTIVNDDLSLTIVNDDPSLTIVNIIVNKKNFKNDCFLKTDRFFKNNHIKTVANRFIRNDRFQKRSLFVF